MPLIGRQKEKAQIDAWLRSGQPEFVALYGRRRIGKTYLIRELFGDRFAFSVSGVIGGSRQEQLAAFNQALRNYDRAGSPVKDWMEAFAALQTLLEASEAPERRVVFIDEIPCFDTRGSRFIHALDHFWNTWASRQKDLMLIVCGSATSWMIKNIVDNHGGLHNRLTHEIHLNPFTLKEVEEYLVSRSFTWGRLSILQAYMAFGGVPYYLSLLDAGTSLAQNIDRLVFAKDAPLAREYRRLYASLFSAPDNYMKIINLLAEKKEGLTRSEIAAGIGADANGHLTAMLEDLVYCDIIRYFNVTGKKIKERSGIYQLVDFFTLFHLTFNGKRTTDDQFWSHQIGTPKQNAWHGFAFERVCLAHIGAVKAALGISGIRTEYYAWRSTTTTPKSQIDLILDRADQMVNVFEIKYSDGPYALTRTEAEKLRLRLANFREETRIRKGLFLSMITTFGLKQGPYSDLITAVLTLEDLFR